MRHRLTGLRSRCVTLGGLCDGRGRQRAFYAVILGARKGADPEKAGGTCYYLSTQQFVEVLPAPADHGASMLAHVAYNTVDAAGLRAYFAAHGVIGAGNLHHSAGGSLVLGQ